MIPTIPSNIPEPTSDRWQLLRAGIQNIWEYDDQRFVFHKGRLLLRGQNESGKTKALEVLLPYLLDASLQPHRLDPFGSNARSMKWNLINDANAEVTIAIGYVWVELGRVDEDGEPCFKTLGAGLKARRNGPGVEDWYFITGERIDVDLTLLDEHRVPLTRANLERALAERGTIFETSAAYRRGVNETLFGLADPQYAALVDALLQLRRPQLSKALDPAELSSILSASLPPLDGAVIDSLAEGFDRLDRHRTEREECQLTLASIHGFMDVYRQYASVMAKSRALEVTRAESAIRTARARLKELEAKHAAACEAVVARETEIRALEEEDLGLEERGRALRDSDEFRAVAQLDEAERQAKKVREAAERASRARDDGRESLRRATERREIASAAARTDAEKLAEEKNAAALAADACFMAGTQGAVVASLSEAKIASARAALEVALRLRREAIDALRRLERRLDEMTRAEERAAERATRAEEHLRACDERLREAVAAEGRAREAFVVEVESWARRSVELQVDVPWLLDHAAEAMRRAIEVPLAERRETLDEALRVAATAHDTATRERGEVVEARRTLEAQTYRPPQAPAWRGVRSTDRPGSPLYMLCEISGDLDATLRGGLEGALEAAGILDAWLTPEGELLDPATSDVVLMPKPIAKGPTLADVLVPVAGGAVTEERVLLVLRSIGLGESSGAAWVSTSGAFELGPLHGRHQKLEAEFIGIAARERARVDALSQLEARITLLDAEVARCAHAVTAVRERRKKLEEELGAFPDGGSLRDAVTSCRERSVDLTGARSAHDVDLERLRTANRVRVAALNAMEELAAESGLRAWVGRLDDLVSLTANYRAAAGSLIKADEGARRSRNVAEELARDLTSIGESAQRAESTAEQALLDANGAEARADALRQAVGKTRSDLMERVRATETQHNEVRAALKRNRQEESSARTEAGAAAGLVREADSRVLGCETSRQEAEGRFRSADARGLLAMIGVARPESDHPWTYTDVLTTARRVDESTGKLDVSEGAQDRSWNRVTERHQDLTRSLRAELRVIASKIDGLNVYEATLNARRLTLLELELELENDLAARDRLLADEERKLFESFLTGEAHEHLREQLRAASALVKRMNKQLSAHPTSSGMTMRLEWGVADEAPPGTKEAVALLFKSGALLADSDRGALLGFLKQRLDQARTSAGSQPLQEQLASVLDYRAWHTFEVEFRSGEEPWRKLTKRVHGAGSGGQKAVMLHLPLFAAAAAFYDSARSNAPRFILLDEAFAGIDRQTRGELMGLLTDFDLDFVMTSFEEWGFYPQVDGLSTYHLAREKGMRGVYSEWFVWNGKEATPQHGPSRE